MLIINSLGVAIFVPSLAQEFISVAGKGGMAHNTKICESMSSADEYDANKQTFEK